jgi:hypothetical protein
MANRTFFEALIDLKHDLAKYIRMPVAWLSPAANQEDLRAALKLALFETRVQGDQRVSAREIWEQFRAEFGDNLAQTSGGKTLVDAVERALRWGDHLEDPAPLERATILGDMERVGSEIRAIIEEVGDG